MAGYGSNNRGHHSIMVVRVMPDKKLRDGVS
jgi:hypothetical protein